MSISSHKAILACAAAISCALAFAAPTSGQQQVAASSVKFQVKGAAERLDMTVNTSRIVEFQFDVPKILVNNPELVRAVPISPRSIQLSALRSGVTQLNVWDANENITSLDVTILGDVAELDGTLKTLFPSASLQLRPLNSSLYISGFVSKAEMVGSIMRVAQDYFPNIINDMTVGGVHKILLHVKVMEVSRTKIRAIGFDYDIFSEGGGFFTQTVSQLVPGVPPFNADAFSTVRFAVTNGGTEFQGFLQALRQYDLAKLLSEPTLTTLDGRPASFNVGGEIPIPIQQSLGVTTIQWREFGTRIDFVPILLGNGTVRLEVRPEISQVDPGLRDSVTGTVGFRSRRADTAVELKAGQTLAIAGLIENRVEATNRGLPILADLPWFGFPFRRVQERTNEIETIIFVTPEFSEAMDACEVPPCGPGQHTTSPSDCELYGRGYLEVPKNCQGGNGGPGGMSNGLLGPGYETLPSTQGQPAQPAAPPAPSARRQLPPVVSPQRVQQATNMPAAQQPAAVGTGAVARPVSNTRTTGSPQNAYSSQDASGTPQKPSYAAQPMLIGPLGYDDLK
jgi:pilus assembly protein CpaC